jgi:hypothetical protein
MPSSAYFSKVGGLAAILGVVVLFVATFLHPMDAQPSDPRAAFAEYAADQFWVASHLGQLLGVMLISGGLVSLSWRLRAGRADVWASLGAVGAVASLALSGALQAVDGIALKVMVDRWAAAAPDARPLLFEAAFAVRQIEIGLASMVNVFFGFTALLYGLALFSGGASRWLGWLGIIAGAATVTSGILQAHTGFSEVAMAAGMPSNLLLLLWTLLVGAFLLRSSRMESSQVIEEKGKKA